MTDHQAPDAARGECRRTLHDEDDEQAAAPAKKRRSGDDEDDARLK